jgi:hypothetical protein
MSMTAAPRHLWMPPQKMWIIPCFIAMSHTSLDEVVANYNKAAARLVAAAKKKLDERGE